MHLSSDAVYWREQDKKCHPHGWSQQAIAQNESQQMGIAYIILS